MFTRSAGSPAAAPRGRGASTRGATLFAAALLTLALALAGASPPVTAAAGAGAPVGGAEGTVIELDGSGVGNFDEFGTAVDIDGDRAAVGAPIPNTFGTESVYLFERDAGGPGAWGQVARIDGENVDDDFGAAVALQGDLLVVGAPHAASPDGLGVGEVSVYERDASGAWILAARLVAPDPNPHDGFGTALALDGDTLVVGTGGILSDAEAAHLFERDPVSGVWSETARLTPSDGGEDDRFGSAVAVLGDTVVVGAPRHEELGTWSGAAYVFERDAGGADAWGETAKLTASDGIAYDQFGRSVAAGPGRAESTAPRTGGAIEARELLVGSPFSDSEIGSTGQGILYASDGAGGWAETARLVPAGLALGDRFGITVALDGDVAVIGATKDDLARGRVWAFQRDAGGPDAWGVAARLDAGDRHPESGLGAAAALSGLRVVAGAPEEDLRSGTAWLYELTTFGPDLEVTGECPGAVTVSVRGAAPGARFGLLAAAERGSDPVPSGPCAGTELELAAPRPLDVFEIDALGNLELDLDLGAGSCGAHLQGLVLSTCRTSRVDQVPQPPIEIAYDPGAPADFFVPSTLDDRSVGNVFDTASGSPLAGGTLTGIRYYLRAGDDFGFARFTLWPPAAAAGGTVEPVETFQILDPVTATFATLELANGFEVGPRFLLGMRLAESGGFYGGSTHGSVGMRTATVDGQGFHGFMLERDGSGAGVGKNFQAVPANAMIRALGGLGSGVLLPVELMRDTADER